LPSGNIIISSGTASRADTTNLIYPLVDLMKLISYSSFFYWSKKLTFSSSCSSTRLLKNEKNRVIVDAGIVVVVSVRMNSRLLQHGY